MTTRIGPTETFVFRLFTTNPLASPGRAWTRSSSPRPGLGATVRQELALGIAANARQVVLTESFHELVRLPRRIPPPVVRKLQIRPHGNLPE